MWMNAPRFVGIAGLLVACGASSAPPIETTGPDGPPPSSGSSSQPSSGETPRAGGAGCSPSASVPAPSYRLASNIAPACSGPAILSYYQTCFGSNFNGAGCAGWIAENGACNVCLSEDSDPAGDAWGPFVVYPLVSVLNEGGCVARRAYGDSFCSEALEEVQECEHSACDAQCTNVADESTCLSAARAEACAAYEQAANSECGDSPCFATSDLQASFVNIASVFCL